VGANLKIPYNNIKGSRDFWLEYLGEYPGWEGKSSCARSVRGPLVLPYDWFVTKGIRGLRTMSRSTLPWTRAPSPRVRWE